VFWVNNNRLSNRGHLWKGCRKLEEVDKDETQEVDEEIRRIIDDRMATLDEDLKHAVNAREFLAEMRRRLRERSRKPGKPRSGDLSH
jgi:hypothetical protein